MRRALAVALLSLTACAGETATRTASEDPTPTTAGAPFEDRIDYLVSLDLADGTINLAAQVGDDRAYELGLIACGQLDADSDLLAAFDRMRQEPEFLVSNTATGPAMPAIIAIATNHLCPEHAASVQSQLDR